MNENKQINFIVVADLHHYSPTLGITGNAYTMRSESDQKMLAKTGALIRAAFDEMTAADIDFILIVGDVTNNGETVSHEEFRELMYEYQQKKPIYIITSTHDWCSDNNPRRYDGDNVYNDVPSLKMEELTEYYKDFGLTDALSVYKTSAGNASYVVRPCEGLTVFCLNDDFNEEGGSGFSDEHIEWIKTECDKAKKRNDNIIGANHHPYLLTEFDKLINNSKTVKYKNELAVKVAKAGIPIAFVGHTHMQHIIKLEADGSEFYEINVAALSGYPAAMVYCTVAENQLKIDVKHLQKFTYDGKEYTNEYLKNHATNLFTKVVKAAANNNLDEFIALVAAIGMGKKKAAKLWRFLRLPIKKLDTATVKGTARLINAFTFGKAIDKKAAKEIGNERVLDVALQVFLNILDGGIEKANEDDAKYKVVSDAVSLPYRIVKTFRIKNSTLINTLNKIQNVVKPIMTGGEINSNSAVINFQKQ